MADPKTKTELLQVRIGISSCLLGERVRYDGGHKRDSFLAEGLFKSSSRRIDASEPSVKILLTGATGYIGGRLLQALKAKHYEVRCMARNPEFLRARVGAGTEILAGNALRYETLPPVLKGVDVAYYLIHSMGSAGNFEEDDRLAAANFGRACSESGVEKIVYLGGLGEDNRKLSSHLRSRHEVGTILRKSKVPVHRCAQRKQKG
jgi:hypothetical protein